MLFLISRLSAVVLSASMVKQKARFPLRFFEQIPTQAWNDEIQRFFDRIRHDEPAISGKHFFTLSKTLLFNLLAIIITYEVVLLQFSADDGGHNTYNVDCQKAFILSS